MFSLAAAAAKSVRHSRQISIIILAIFANFSSACVATRGGGTVRTTTVPTVTTTTVPGETTTTVITTTTVAAACAPEQIIFGTSMGNEVDVTFTDYVVDNASQTASMTITCSAAAGMSVFMEFNVDQGGPSQNFLPTVNAPVTCEDGQWVFRETVGGAEFTRTIQQVNCFQV
ncbi:unnamed protein product [Caenorhabditis bovis]|uniref:C6 domain-containing protein n=1 Tax=Caenorhabditis bovis TaxID=2654633 RepID=A0A8S1E7U1_9PELO|nr:unnamed protein product [Caenorhabditis bovis]